MGKTREDDIITDPLKLIEWIDTVILSGGVGEDGYPFPDARFHEQEWAMIKNALRSYKQTWTDTLKAIAEAK